MTDTKVYSEFSTLCRLRFHVFSPSKKVFPCLVFRKCSIIILVFWWIWMAGDGWGFGRWDHGDIPNQKKSPIPICNRCLPWRNCPASSFRMGLTKPPVGFDEIHHSSGRVRIFGHPMAPFKINSLISHLNSPKLGSKSCFCCQNDT